MEIANSPAIAAAIPEPVISEPISPELVLVDPVLRRAVLERARLQVVPAPEPLLEPEPVAEPMPVERPMVVALPAPVSTAPRRVPLPPLAPRPPSWPRRNLPRVLLPLSLAANAILIAVVVSDARVSSSSPPPAPALNLTAPTGNPGSASSQKSGSQAHARPRLGARDGALERKLLTTIVQSPAGKLPRGLIDSKTGLAKNGLQAVCRHETGRRSFLCVVQPPKHKSGEGLYVRYRLNRKGKGGSFTWYRYRNG
jgi:hypothetical protein